MSTELQSSGDESSRLDLLLSQYLQTNQGELHRIACPPWQRLRPTEQNRPSFDNMANARPSSTVSPIRSYTPGQFN